MKWPVATRGNLKRDALIRRVWTELEPELAEQGYELVEAEYGKQGGSPVLRLFIDKEGGITLDDCSAASQLVNPILDADDFIPGAYMLEVSSPGIDRPVRKPEDFERFIGERIKLESYTAVLGRARFTGELKGLEDGMVVVECDGTTYQIHQENLKKARLVR